MSRLARVRAKKKNDEAMNLTELALLTGYDRNTLGAMLLPLERGKIFYTDFRRILAARQDRHEDSVRYLKLVAPLPVVPPGASASAEEARPTKSLADKFRAPKSKYVRPVASHARAGSPHHNTQLQRKRA